MKRTASIAALLLGLSFSAIAEPIPAPLARSIAAGGQVQATMQNGVLRAVLARPGVSFDAFESFITGKVCAPYLLDARAGWGGARISRVELRDESQVQGYAVQDPRQVCDAIGSIEGGAVNVKKYLAPIAWVCVAGNECRPRRQGERYSGDE